MVKFAHLADVHLDAWREEEFKRLNFLAFSKAIDTVIKEKVDFVIVAGDLFHTSMPSILSMRLVAKKFKELKERGIEVFVVPGSHDYTKEEMSVIDVMEEAGLCVNVAKADVDEEGKIRLLPTYYKDKVALYGMMGKKNGLEIELYKQLLPVNLDDKMINIFVMHSGVEELNSKKFAEVPSVSSSLLPKGFDYYASGHIHEHKITHTLEGNVFVFPGHLYPSNFKELEESRGKGFYVIVNVNESNKQIDIEKKEVHLYDVEFMDLNLEGLTPAEATSKIINEFENKDLKYKIVLLRLRGTLNGSISHINFRHIKELVMSKGAYAYKKNISKLSSRLLEEEQIYVKDVESIAQIEQEMINENLQENMRNFALKLMGVLEKEKGEEETSEAYKTRLMSEAMEVVEEVVKNKD